MNFKQTFLTVTNQIHNIARKEIKVLFAVFLIIGGTWFFLELGDEVGEGSTKKFDEMVLKSLRNAENYEEPKGPQWLGVAMRDITSLGGGTTISIITLIITGFLLLQKQHGALLLILAATLGGVLLNLTLKELFGRERPDIVLHLVSVESLSFPSGHSMMSAVVYLTQAALLARIQKRRGLRIYIITAALVLIFMIGISRIYLGVHYPTDVLAGWSVGLVWASICWIIVWYIQNKRRSREIILDEDEQSLKIGQD